MIEVTKRIEFDAGHRVPDHQSKCRHLHGHRYVVEAAVYGRVLDQAGDPENGMVLDFGVLKALLHERIHDEWDHRMLLHTTDPVLGHGSDEWQADIGVVRVPMVPTAENLAYIIAQRLIPGVAAWCDELELVRVTVWETPTCSAVWQP